ncbi:hypothetical protein JXA32_15480 [Candidatus Sumerlaeota bacterium]|nr:hypothetical protein [Candidatus Sumerlaeota bacterium]
MQFLDYIQYKEACQDIERFQHLVRHYIGWEHLISDAPPLQDLIPETTEDMQTNRQLLERELNRLIPVVRRYLHIADVEMEYGIKRRDKQEGFFNLLSDFFSPPQRLNPPLYEMVLRATDQGLGYFEKKKLWAKRNLYNPLFWLGCLLGMPLDVLKTAGIESPNKILEEAYGWIIRVLLFIGLTLLIRYYWPDITFEQIKSVLKL